MWSFSLLDTHHYNLVTHFLKLSLKAQIPVQTKTKRKNHYNKTFFLVFTFNCILKCTFFFPFPLADFKFHLKID